jgi:hypothetical protein
MPAPDSYDPARFAGRDDAQAGSSRQRSSIEPVPVFDAASSVRVDIEILQESYAELLRIIEANEWTLDEGLTTVFLAGIGMQKGLVYLDEVNDLAAHGDAHASKRVDDIVQELAAYHSMYSVMKFKAFKQYKLNQALEFNNAGLRAQEIMWQEWAERMRRERDTLNAELVRLRSLLSEFKLDWEESGAPPLPPGVFASLKVKELESQPPPPETERPVVQETPSLMARLKKLLGG